MPFCSILSQIWSAKTLLVPQKSEIILVLSNCFFFHCRSSRDKLPLITIFAYSFSFSSWKRITKVVVKSHVFLLDPIQYWTFIFGLCKIIAFILLKCCNKWKNDNYMGSNTEKKPWTNIQNNTKIKQRGNANSDIFKKLWKLKEW